MRARQLKKSTPSKKIVQRLLHTGTLERRGSAATFLHNGLKNADAQSGTGQTVVASRQYEAFGNVASSIG